MATSTTVSLPVLQTFQQGKGSGNFGMPDFDQLNKLVTQINNLSGNGTLAGVMGLGIGFKTVSTAPTANNLAAVAGDLALATDEVTINLTAVLGAGATYTLPTVAAVVAAFAANGIKVQVGSSYKLRIANESSANFAWTLTADSGATWTLAGTSQAVAQHAVGEWQVLFTSLTAGTMTSMGGYALTQAP